MNRRESKRKSQAECAGLSEPGTGKSRPRRNWRRMTCPNPISKSVIDMALGELTKACSLGELIEKCLLAFDTDGNLRCSDYTVNMTLTVHSWVVPSVELAHRLLALYQEASGEERRLRICHFIRFWLTRYPEAFRLDHQLEEAMAEIWNVVRKEGHEAHCRLLDTSDALAHVWNRKLSYQGSPACGRKRKVSLLFDHLDAEQLAEHLSYLEFKAFCRLSHLDFQSYVLRGSVRGSLALEHSVTLCNSISQWVQVMILNRPTAQQRAEVFAKFLHVTQKLHQLQNFNTLMAVVGGLCHSTISRLKETRALLPNEVTKALSEMTELLSSCGNYGTYRRVYSECRGFKIPIVGVHLKDLVTVHEALPDRLEGGRLNLSKLHSLYQPLQELRELQQATHPFQANKDLVHLLTLSLDLFFTDEEIYALSYAREPRYPKSLPSTPFKPPLVDWPPAVTPKRDRLTITRHIQQLVESLFKNYDPEQQGYISQEDFKKIAASFPFSFYGLDKEREGPYSRQEISDYFMRACPIFSRLGMGFLHDFHEATFMKPTFCDSCGGFLWGVSKQGYRCRECGTVCHKHCKDQVEAECQRWFHARTSEERTPCPAMSAPAQHPGSGSEEETFLFPGQQEEPGKDHAIVLAGVPGSPRQRYTSTQTTSVGPTLEGRPCSKSQKLLEQLKELEKERDKLLWENLGLQCRNSQLEAENSRLLGQMAPGRGQPDVTLILKGMDSLHLPHDSTA